MGLTAVPLDLDWDGCQSFAERLVDANPQLRYTVGWARFATGGEWGAHAWVETAGGEVVDLFAAAKWPGVTLDYRRHGYPDDDPDPSTATYPWEG